MNSKINPTGLTRYSSLFFKDKADKEKLMPVGIVKPIIKASVIKPFKKVK